MSRTLQARALLAALALATGCVAPARYLVVTDPTLPTAVPDQREVWLAPDDANAHRHLLGLATPLAAAEQAAACPPQDALDRALWPLLLGRWSEAGAALQAGWEQLPDDLRRLLAADLAVELARPGEPTTRAMALYQEAYDAQRTERTRQIVRLRVHQLRYGR